MYICNNYFHCLTISPHSQLALKHDGARVVQCLLKYGTEQIRGMVYEELKGERGREEDCEDWEKEKRKENSLSVVHELMKLLQITFLSCADSSMPSSL